MEIVQGNGRLLRDYDEIGLLTPEHIDVFTEYGSFAISVAISEYS